MTKQLNTLAVFCGSYSGKDPIYVQSAVILGELLATAKTTLVYGGGNVGIMGAVANSVLDHGGKVIGVIPNFLVRKEIAHPNLTELKVVRSMHERKAMIAEIADGFMALPGGFGTLEEVFEMITWDTLGIVHAPIGILNTNGFYDDMIKQIDRCVKEGFIDQKMRDLVLIDSDPAKLFQKMQDFVMPKTVKWATEVQQS